jgi:hypothetical protein
MTAGCSFPLRWTMLIAVGAAMASASAAEASDFASYFNRYVPSSIRTQIQARVDGATPVKQKREQIGATGSPVATTPGEPIAVAGPTIPAPLPPKDSACLSERHLATGAVLFKDSCTNEWAINSTAMSDHRVDGKCLTKTRHPNGIVVFRNTCSQEWAMNTVENTTENNTEPAPKPAAPQE